MYNRRARPTLRVLKEDLNSEWENPGPKRALEEGIYTSLHPLSELPHPLIRKAVEAFGENENEDARRERIRSATKAIVWKIRYEQWRGAVWADPETGVRWLIAAGRAKGQHKDTDDFYEEVARENDKNDLKNWLPTEEDTRLLKREAGADLRLAWELDIQRQVLEVLRDINAGGTARFEILQPRKQTKLADVKITVSPVRNDGTEADDTIDTDDVVVVVDPVSKFAGSNVLWQLTLRILISISAPEQSWDPFGMTFSNMGEPGQWTKRVAELQQLVERNELAFSEPGKESHYIHRDHLSRKTVEGKAVRSLCGVRFVPLHDHETMPVCPDCTKLYESL